MCEKEKKEVDREKLIQHLGNEITTHTAYLMTFRSRVAFTILVGPFVVLGSFLIATKRVIQPNMQELGTGAIAGAIACICYLGLGWYGAMLDSHVTGQCDKWRRLIHKLHEGASIKEEDLLFVHQNPTVAYLTGLVLVLGAFIATTYMIFSLLATSGGLTSGSSQ